MKHIYTFQFDGAEYTADIEMKETTKEWTDVRHVSADKYSWRTEAWAKFKVMNKNRHVVKSGGFQISIGVSEMFGIFADEMLESSLNEFLRKGMFERQLGIHEDDDDTNFREAVNEAYQYRGQ